MKIYNLKSPIFILFVVFHLAICSIENGNKRRVGNFTAHPGSGRYHASIQNLNKYHICGGAIISVRHVLTAAHCVFGNYPDFIRVVVGTSNLDVGAQYYAVDYFKVNNAFIEPVLQNDLAVIKIRGVFNLKEVQIINLSQVELQERDEVLFIGFGAPSRNASTSRLMHYLYLPVVKQQRCANVLHSFRPVTDKMFCTFTKFGQGTCVGDSGGPLTKGNQLVGIVSWGIPSAVGFPDVHTRISSYVTWIQEQINKP